MPAEVSNGNHQDVHSLVLGTMIPYEGNIVIRNDNLLLLNAYTQMQTTDIARTGDTRWNIRLKLLAKVLIKLQKVSGFENAKSVDLVLPQDFNAILKTVKEMTGYEGPRNTAKPNIFMLIGLQLKYLCISARKKPVTEGTTDMLEILRRFLGLFEAEWKIDSQGAKETYEENKLNIPELLPEE